ncbi:MAG TPA: winged helix-turn-helix transcriptional regulator [Nitrososphaeraceae archaeon]|nr:winged helix-turn-helix transcriptional regulator [Nitrososphaeraceae archaeon]
MQHNNIRLDNTDLQIIRLLARDCRTPYRNISSIVGITTNAVKERIGKMVSSGIIQKFVVLVNPIIFGYEKECILILRHIDKIIKEKDILSRINLLGDVFVYAKHLNGSSMFVLELPDGAQEKVGTIIDLLKNKLENIIFVSYRPLTMGVTSSDLEIMRYLLLSNPRMLVEDVAKETSLSAKTVARRLEKMRENHILEFSILTNLSSMHLIGYIEFAVVIDIDISCHQNIIERIYYEMQEYLLIVPNSYQKEVIFAVFFGANIPTVNKILRTLESFDGVNKVDVFLTTSLVYYQEWLKRAIDKRIKSKESQKQQQKNV